MLMDFQSLISSHPILQSIADAEEVVWYNTAHKPYEICRGALPVSSANIQDASDRLKRFAPLIRVLFPETVPAQGLIESPLREIPNMKALLCGAADAIGRLYIKMDSHLPVSGSVKARGGFYEVLKHAEELALANGILRDEQDDYLKLLSESAKSLFSTHKIQVGSTGNLGLSIGLMSRALGFQAIVHMSADAKQWKKDLLRSRGSEVVEYEGDYGAAVQTGRILSDQDPTSYFIDDENSLDLFCGYSVAGERLASQLSEMKILVDEANPLFVYIPCGVGGAPGGVSYGLKEQFGDNVHIFLIEPTQAPCMLLGIETNLLNKISAQDIGLTGKTEADGLAVGRCSSLAGSVLGKIIDGEITVADNRLHSYSRMLFESEHIFIEPSAAAAFHGPAELASAHSNSPLSAEFIKKGTHIVWATGGNLVPHEVRSDILKSEEGHL